MRRVCVLVAIALVLAGCSASKQRTEPTSNAGPSATSTVAPTPTATPCAVAGALMGTARGNGTGKQALLTDVRNTASGCPRVVFEFQNAPPSYVVEYRNPPFSNCGSGARVDTSSWGASAYLVVHSNEASGVDLAGPTFRQTYKGPKDIAVSGAVLRRIYETCDFEGTLEWIIALDGRHAYKVSTPSEPPRLVIDVSEAHA